MIGEMDHAVVVGNDGASTTNQHRVGARSLTAIGLGGLIGAGIFVTVGIAAREQAGPAVLLSFLVAAAACVAVALCFCECASRVPIAGSTYAYGDAAAGRLVGWISGWNLATCYFLAGAAVAQGWSGYFQSFLGALGFSWPAVVGGSPLSVDSSTGKWGASGAILDLPALLILAVITVVVYRGMKPSLRLNAIILALKLSVLAVVVLVGLYHFRLSNWLPFAPYGYGGLSIASILSGGRPAAGVLAAAPTAFFAFGGFEMLSAYSAEARRPRRDVPIAIVATVGLLTLIYIAVAAAITGMVPYQEISVSAPIADAFRSAGMPWAQTLIAVGALAGMTSVLLVVVMSLPRVLMGVGRDGLLPAHVFRELHPVYGTPHRSVALVGVAAMVFAATLPLRMVIDAVMMSSMAGYVSVCLFVLILRSRSHSTGKEKPEFLIPMGPVIPLFGIASCLLLMLTLPRVNWLLMGGWWLIGAGVFGLFRRRAHTR